MDEFDYWHLCDTLNVKQAALLIAGEDPSSAQYHVESWPPDKRPKGYEPAKSAICNAISRGVFPAFKREETDFVLVNDERGMPSWQSFGVSQLDLELTVIRVDHLRKWLADRGFKSGFFFERGGNIPNYLDTNNPYYAPKLAAAVEAWEAVSANPKLLQGKSPKQALMKWLREKAISFGLNNEDGKPNETGIEEIAKVANWSAGGGAPKTLIEPEENGADQGKRLTIDDDALDDEIPF